MWKSIYKKLVCSRLLLLLLLSAPVLFRLLPAPQALSEALLLGQLGPQDVGGIPLCCSSVFFFDPSIFCRKLFARHNIPRDDVTKFKLTVPAQPIKASKVFQCSMFAGLWSVWKVQLVDWPESTLTGRTWQKWRLYRPTKVLPSIWGQLQWWPGTFNLFLCHMSIPQTNHVLRQNRWARAS